MNTAASSFRLLLLVIVGHVAIAAEPAEKPNVILFLVDDMGWMDSTVYGSQYYETPEMERLARQSMRFTDAYAVPLCSPTRASILSGQYSARHGVTSASGHQPPQPEGASRYPNSAPPNKKLIYADSKNYLDPALITLPEVLQQAGYRTGHFGKWHLGATPQYWPDKHGFETAWFCTPDPGPPSYFSPYGVVRDGRPAGRQKVGTITDGPRGEYITDRLTDEAIKFIKADRNEPFYLNLCQYAVHGPWGHKEEFTKDFATKVDPRGEQRNPIMASMLKSVDQSLGRILDTLAELELAENTLFIFYSDNGGNTHSNTPDSRQMQNIKPGHPKWEFVQDWRRWAGAEPPTNNAPLREGKGRIYEGGQRVPLMVRWPGRIEPNSESDAIVGPIDLYPTILDALQLERPQAHILDGVSFLPVLTQQQQELEREALFTWFPHLIPAVSVRAGDYKLIRRWEPHPSYPDLYELYNVEEDIGETTNLADKMPAKVRELDALIDDFIERTGALAPKPNPNFDPKRAAANAAARSPAAGLVPKMCTVSLVPGALRIEADGRKPFLGTAQVRMKGPITLRLRARSRTGGAAKVQWKTAAQASFPEEGQVVDFQIEGGNVWRDISLTLPVRGTAGIVRIYLPAQTSPVEIASIVFTSAEEIRKSWDFDGADH